MNKNLMSGYIIFITMLLFILTFNRFIIKSSRLVSLIYYNIFFSFLLIIFSYIVFRNTKFSNFPNMLYFRNKLGYVKIEFKKKLKIIKIFFTDQGIKIKKIFVN